MRQKRTGKRTDGAESESSVNRLRLIVSVNGCPPKGCCIPSAEGVSPRPSRTLEPVECITVRQARSPTPHPAKSTVGLISQPRRTRGAFYGQKTSLVWPEIGMNCQVAGETAVPGNVYLAKLHGPGYIGLCIEPH